jgi:hypothetical protein
MHQADAGSDAYDRDFALNLLTQEQDAFFTISRLFLQSSAKEEAQIPTRGWRAPHLPAPSKSHVFMLERTEGDGGRTTRLSRNQAGDRP